MLCAAIPMPFTAARFPSTIPASSRLARCSFPETIHHTVRNTFGDRGAVTRIFAASQLSCVAAKVGENNRPTTCCTAIPTCVSGTLPISHAASSCNSSGPCRTAAARASSAAPNFACADARLAESRPIVVGKRFPANERTFRARLTISQFKIGHRKLNLRSIRAS